MPHRRTKPSTFTYSRELRNKLTDAETKLWRSLRMRQTDGIRFRRQHAIGPYIVDFCAIRQHLIIEVDGGQHVDNEEFDLHRTAFLEQKGYKVLRFWNDEVLEKLDAVMQVILEELSAQNL